MEEHTRSKLLILIPGTPLQNNKRELFNLLQFLDASINAADLDEEYAVLTKENLPSLHDLIRPFFLRYDWVQSKLAHFAEQIQENKTSSIEVPTAYGTSHLAGHNELGAKEAVQINSSERPWPYSIDIWSDKNSATSNGARKFEQHLNAASKVSLPPFPIQFCY